MTPAINLVCTRCTDGNPMALRRWYADHVHLLLAAPELVAAKLHRCMLPLAGQPPDYFCIYEFSSHDDFLAFEHGQPKAIASELTNAAAGRSSIEIVQRTQYVRWLHRGWATAGHEQGAVWQLAVCLDNETAWTLDAQRWLADHLQAVQSRSPLLSAQIFSREGQTFMMLDFAGGEATDLWKLLQDQLAQPALFGKAPSLQMHWAASATACQEWLR